MTVATRTRDEEFTDFVREARATLMRSAVLIAGNRTAGEDLVQEALVRAYVRWGSIEPATAVAYIRRIMVNLATDQFRRRKHEPVAMDLDGDRAWAEAPASARDIGAVDDRADIVGRLRVLNARERAIVVLRYYFDLSEIQAAEEMGVSVGTIKSTCSRALAKMRAAPGYATPGGHHG